MRHKSTHTLPALALALSLAACNGGGGFGPPVADPSAHRGEVLVLGLVLDMSTSAANPSRRCSEAATWVAKQLAANGRRTVVVHLVGTGSIGRDREPVPVDPFKFDGRPGPFEDPDAAGIRRDALVRDMQAQCLAQLKVQRGSAIVDAARRVGRALSDDADAYAGQGYEVEARLWIASDLRENLDPVVTARLHARAPKPLPPSATIHLPKGAAVFVCGIADVDDAGTGAPDVAPSTVEAVWGALFEGHPFHITSRCPVSATPTPSTEKTR